MARLAKIYTKRGDQGETSLGGGQRVRKDTLRVQVYGTVDELNSQIGVALAVGLCDQLTTALSEVQSELFDVGSDLCFIEEDKAEVARCRRSKQRHVARLEALIDEITAELGRSKTLSCPADRWVRRSCMWRAPSAAAPSAKRRRWPAKKLSASMCCLISTASPTRFLSWRAMRISCRTWRNRCSGGGSGRVLTQRLNGAKTKS